MSQPATIEQLKSRFEDLNKQKIQVETQLETAEKNLAGLKKEAREKFGSDDLKTLEKQLKEIKAENESKRAKYEKQLNSIESDLTGIEAKFVDDHEVSEDES